MSQNDSAVSQVSFAQEQKNWGQDMVTHPFLFSTTWLFCHLHDQDSRLKSALSFGPSPLSLVSPSFVPPSYLRFLVVKASSVISARSAPLPLVPLSRNPYPASSPAPAPRDTYFFRVMCSLSGQLYLTRPNTPTPTSPPPFPRARFLPSTPVCLLFVRV